MRVTTEANMTTTKFDKVTLRVLREDIDAALISVAATRSANPSLTTRPAARICLPAHLNVPFHLIHHRQSQHPQPLVLQSQHRLLAQPIRPELTRRHQNVS